MNSERNIIMKLKESKKLEESGFYVGNDHYYCAFGRYYKNGKEISKEEYERARALQGGTEYPTDDEATDAAKDAGLDGEKIKSYNTGTGTRLAVHSSDIEKSGSKGISNTPDAHIKCNDTKSMMLDSYESKMSGFNSKFSELGIKKSGDRYARWEPSNPQIYGNYRSEKPLSNKEINSLIEYAESQGYKSSISGDSIKLVNSDDCTITLDRGAKNTLIQVEWSDKELASKFNKDSSAATKARKEYLSKVDWKSKEFNSNVEGMSQEDLLKKFTEVPVARIHLPSSWTLSSDYLVHPDGTIVKSYDGVWHKMEPVSDKVVNSVKEKVLAGKYKTWGGLVFDNGKSEGNWY